MTEPPMTDVSSSSANETPVATPALEGVDEQAASESQTVSDGNLQVPKGLSGQRPGSDLEDLLKQHEEIIDWNAAVETAIIENPSLLKTDTELSDAVKKMSVTPALEFRPPFYAFVTGISFQAKREDIFYFFGGPKNVENVHIYINPPHANQPNKFSGDAMLKLKSLEALVEVLKMDGEELFTRLVNVFHVQPGNRVDRKRYSALQLENVRLAPGYQQNDRGHYRQDSRASTGHSQRESYSPRQGNQPPPRNAYQPSQHQRTQQTREKFMPKRESNDVRAYQPQQTQTIYQQQPPIHHQGPAQARQSMQGPYPPQGGYNRVPSSGQTWTENAPVEIKEKPAPVQRQKSADIFGTKPVDTRQKMLEIEKKMESEQKGRTPRESESSVHHQPPQYGDRRSGEHRQPGGYNRMSSNSSSVQSLSQQQQFQPTRILQNTNPQYQQRKQSTESGHYPVPLNQCHPNARGSTQHLDNAPSQPTNEVLQSNQWDNSMANEVLNVEAPSGLDSETGVEQMQRHTGGGPKRQISGTGRSGSESSANYQQGPPQHYQREQQPYLPNQKQYKKQMSRDSTGGGGHPPRHPPQRYQQQRQNRSDNRDIREEKGRVDKNHESHRSDHNENKVPRDDERHQQQQYRPKQGQYHHHKGGRGAGGQDRGGSPTRRSPPRVAKESISTIQNYIQKGDKDQHQNAKGSDIQGHDQQSQPPSGQSTLRRPHNRRTFVNQHRENRRDYKNEDGANRPANVRKKQSIDSETAHDDQHKESNQRGGRSNYHHGGRGSGARFQNRSDSIPLNVDSSQKTTQDKSKEAPKEVNEQPPPDPVSSTPRASIQQADIQQQQQPDNINNPQKNPETPPASGGGSAKKKDNKKKAKKDAGGSSLTTNNKFSALSDCKEYEV